MPDGSRVNAVIRPLALDGALVSIRRFSQTPLSAAQLIAQRSATPEMLAFPGRGRARADEHSRLSGTGSGKTTLLNLLSGFIPPANAW